MEREFFASCLTGLESALADELKALGIERVRPLSGGVAFFGAAQHAYRACLWSRLASRVMLVEGRVDASTADTLYEGAAAIPWEDVLAEGCSFTVRAHGTNENLRNTRFTALKVKDAIVDRLRPRRGSLGEPNRPRVSFEVRVRGNRAAISLDFSGESLGHRDYLAAEDGEDAAFSCLKVAGALALSGWSAHAASLPALVDPVCRDGILLVEAASLAFDRAAGLNRERWGFLGWTQHDQSQWLELKAEANRRFESALARVGVNRGVSSDMVPDLTKVRLVGASSSSPAISRARAHVKRAGLRSVASVELGDISSTAALVERVKGIVACAHEINDKPFFMVASDLDASARVNSPAHVQADEAVFVAACAAAPAGSIFVAVDGQEAAARFGEKPAFRLRLGRDRVATAVEVFDMLPKRARSLGIPDLAGGQPHVVNVLEDASDQFAARLRKVFKERRKWASREGVSCYRVYDSDLPDYAVAIDWYTGVGDARGNNYLHIAEYAPPSSVDADRARRRWQDVLTIAPIVCGVRPDHVFSKRRAREKGGSQYRSVGTRSYVTMIEEGGYRFEVDLSSRLDTGLFLDHRITRALVRDAAEGARFLNLFAYTGTASVYAAGGGAVETTTVDLSQTYIDWARRNMEANGFKGKAYQFERADVLRWITQARRSQNKYDLVFVDPPTFSNSKAMGRKTWDVQRDHVELLIGVVHLLAKGGQAIFSCNLRNFRPDIEQLEHYGVAIEDISLDTIPEDFIRTPKIHKCYRVRKR